MTLKDQHIIDLMLEHSDLSREEIEHNFSIFKDQLANMEVDERIELSPLGEFIKTGTSMRFVPSVELATEINYKYAGMKPLEIVEANKKTPQSATTDEGFTKAADEPVDDIHLKPDKKEHTVDQPAQPNVDQHKPEEEADKEDHTKNTEENISINDGKEEPSYEDKKTENSEEQKPPTVEVDKSRETEVKERVAKESSQAKENDKKPSGKQHRRKVFTPQDKSQKESIFSLLNTIIAIVIIGGIIFLVYKFDNIKERRSAKIAKEEQAVERPKSEVEEANPATDSSGNGNNAAKNSENSNANLNSGKDVVESFDAVNGTNTNADGDSFYGLYGNGYNEKIVDKGYTIIVHSLKNKAAALNRYSELNKSYQAFLLPYTLASGDTSWRVGIGRFRTVEAALSATDSLKEPYKNNNFIKRITITQ